MLRPGVAPEPCTSCGDYIVICPSTKSACRHRLSKADSISKSVPRAPREVPNIVGLVVGVARAQLVGTELRIVETEEVYDEESEAGLVLSQSPQPGEFVERGGTIEV